MAGTFDELTPRGQVRRLRRLVPLAMAHHDIDVARVRLAAQAFNTTFRVDASDGRRYALRVGSRWHLTTAGIAEVEAVWAAALATDTTVTPPQVVRTRAGAPSVTVGSAGVPGARACVLFTWQEGRTLVGRLHDLALVAAAGEVLAVLHDHTSGFGGVDADQVLRADRVCYFRLPDLLADRGTLFAEGTAWAQESSTGSGATVVRQPLSCSTATSIRATCWSVMAVSSRSTSRTRSGASWSRISPSRW